MPASPYAAADASPDLNSWPGRRLGLPQSGPRSIGRPGRRIAALAIDWGIALLVSAAFYGGDPTANLVIFAVVQYVFLITLSGSPGHLVMGLRVVPVRPGQIGFWRPAVRTVMLCLVIPAVVWDPDQRGLHDKAAGTLLVRR